MKIPRKLIPIPAVLVIAAVVFLLWQPGGARTETLVLEEAPVVQILTATGRIVPDTSIEVKSEITGVVERLYVAEGDRVEAGERLLDIETLQAENQVQSASAALEMAQARLTNLGTSVRAQARETREQVRILRDEQEALVREYGILYDEGALDRASLQQAQNRLDTYQSQLEAADASYRALEPGGGLYGEALASVRQAEQALVAAETTLSKHRLVAPMGGRITALHPNPGELVQPGSTLAVIGSRDRFVADVQIDERSVGLLAVGQPARVWPEAYPSQAVTGRVESVGPRVDPATGTVRVRLLLDDPEGFQIEDLTIRTEIEVRNLENALLLPAAFLAGRNPDRVLVQTGTGPTLRDVRIEPVGLTEYLVVDGLEAGEELQMPPAGP